jgi:preprotein translocase subunit SecD
MTRFTAAFFLAATCLCALVFADDKPKEKPAVKVEFRRAEKEAAEGLIEATVEGSKDKVYLHKTADLTNDDIAEVKASEDTKKQPCLSITLTKDGAAKMKKISEEHRNKPLAILVDGKVLSAPVIKSVIADGKVQFTGKFTPAEIEKLVEAIQGK